MSNFMMGMQKISNLYVCSTYKSESRSTNMDKS